MDTRKIFVGALHFSGAALAAVGVISIAYLCERGLTAPLREMALEDQVHRARMRGRKEGEYQTRPEAYDAGFSEGRRTGYGKGRTAGYDEGYLAGFRKELYAGETPEVISELGLDLKEHAEQLAAKKVEEDAANWDVLEKIFAKEPADESGVKLASPRVPTPAEALMEDTVKEAAGETVAHIETSEDAEAEDADETGRQESQPELL